jgi:hypothetical protein
MGAQPPRAPIARPSWRPIKASGLERRLGMEGTGCVVRSAQAATTNLPMSPVLAKRSEFVPALVANHAPALTAVAFNAGGDQTSAPVVRARDGSFASAHHGFELDCDLLGPSEGVQLALRSPTCVRPRLRYRPTPYARAWRESHLSDRDRRWCRLREVGAGSGRSPWPRRAEAGDPGRH